MVAGCPKPGSYRSHTTAPSGGVNAAKAKMPAIAENNFLCTVPSWLNDYRLRIPDKGFGNYDPHILEFYNKNKDLHAFPFPFRLDDRLLSFWSPSPGKDPHCAKETSSPKRMTAFSVSACARISGHVRVSHSWRFRLCSLSSSLSDSNLAF